MMYLDPATNVVMATMMILYFSKHGDKTKFENKELFKIIRQTNIMSDLNYSVRIIPWFHQ